MSDELVRGAAPQLLDAVAYVLRRIGSDRNVGYYCGAATETLARCCRAYAAATGRDPKEVEREVLDAQKGLPPPDVEALQAQLDALDA